MVFLTVVQVFNLRSLVIEQQQGLVRSQVETAISVARSYLERARNGEFSEAEAQRRARDAIDPIRYRSNDYVFITDEQGLLLIHPRTTDGALSVDPGR